MKFITKFFPKIYLPKLGRWAIHYDTNIINKKIDQANEDHCGCCIINKNMFETESYYLPFFY